jgi:hypothetical protein
MVINWGKILTWNKYLYNEFCSSIKNQLFPDVSSVWVNFSFFNQALEINSYNKW